MRHPAPSRGSPGKMAQRGPYALAGLQGLPRGDDARRVEFAGFGEHQKVGFVAREIVQHRDGEARLPGGLAHPCGIYPGQVRESLDSGLVLRNMGKGRDGDLQRFLAGWRAAVASAVEITNSQQLRPIAADGKTAPVHDTSDGPRCLTRLPQRRF